LEARRKASLVGPHRDDLEMLLDDESLAAFGSQGQQRTAVLALKVAEYTVMQQRNGEAPLLLLDDVLSELDTQRARAFLESVNTFEQAFITAAEMPQGLGPSRCYAIANARLKEVA
ncbi:MAG: DNA replication and repair protein RecF, partial [Candidatus Eremiobacteraeota bacterium]|nr:DNA replication and repair protein RecF [Candidatus Eremiobacteraeota bacterium]